PPLATLFPYTSLFRSLELVERLCDSVGIIAAGRMVAAGTVDELRASNGRRLRVVVRDAAPGWADGLRGEISIEELSVESGGRQVDRKSTRLNSSHVKI